MKRVQITLEYNGSNFVGWQRQENGLGVQEVLEEAIKKLCGESVRVQCAGRTDSGVHALGQVAHFDLICNLSSGKVRDGLNFHLKPNEISIIKAIEVREDFNARFDAIQRSYLYIIIDRRAPLTLDRGRAWWVPKSLDPEIMDKAGKTLIGTHDFSTFRARHCQSRSPIKTLDELNVKRVGENIEITVRAKSFLYHQVRNIAGSLRLVGEGKWAIDDFENAFKAKDRRRGGQTAPAEGLYLLSVRY